MPTMCVRVCVCMCVYVCVCVCVCARAWQASPRGAGPGPGASWGGAHLERDVRRHGLVRAPQVAPVPKVPVAAAHQGGPGLLHQLNHVRHVGLNVLGQACVVCSVRGGGGVCVVVCGWGHARVYGAHVAQGSQGSGLCMWRARCPSRRLAGECLEYHNYTYTPRAPRPLGTHKHPGCALCR